MKASQKRNLLQIGGTAVGATAGAFVGNPMMGAKLGSMAGAAGASLIKDDVLERKSKTIYPELSPAASYSQNVLPNPTSLFYYPQQTQNKFENTMDVLAPLVSGMAPHLLPGAKAPVAQDGMYLPKSAPSHAQGGVNIEVEGGELVLNEEQQIYINQGSTEQERARRYEEVRNMLQSKGMNSQGMAFGGMYVNPSVLNQIMPNFEGIGMPMTGQHQYSGKSLLNRDFRMGPLKPMSERLMEGSAVGGNIDSHRNHMRNAAMDAKRAAGGAGLPVKKGSDEIKKRVEGGGKVTPAGTDNSMLAAINQAIASTERTNRLGAGSDVTKALINMRGLMSSQNLSDPFTAPTATAPTYKSGATEMRGDLDQSMAVGNALVKDLAPEERIGMAANLMQGYQTGLRDISRHQTEVDNANSVARAEAATRNSAFRSDTEKANYERVAMENAQDHMRKNIGLSEMMKSIDSMIQRSGQSGVNVAGLEMLKEMLPNMNEESRVKLLSHFIR